ncbi:alpha/beta fold hydrolase [Qipengyuania nanhaisediminis]|uniref:alpha/beta fold hydrolase n=1 Tax=Qipengyuania nanhaisediminis TaxID=604088 RepID=UPI0038B237F7
MKWVWRALGILVAALVIAFLVLRVPDTDAGQMRAKYGAAPSQFVEIGGGTLVHLRDEGPRDAPVIVLLHGSSADLHTWQPWVDGLADDYRVIRFDQVGHGLTGPDPAHDYSLANYVADIGEVADALGLERFVLGGSSMGGAHAVAFAAAHGERLDGLILVDAGGAPIETEAEGNIGFAIMRTPGLNRIAEHITPRSLVEQSFRQSVSNEDVVTEEAIDRYWELLRYPGNRAATVRRSARDWTYLDAKDVGAIDVPTLVMWGDEDSLISVDAAYWYEEHLPASTLAIYRGIGHLPHEEAPAASLADLRAWLAQTLEPEAGQDPA